jgi:hypothetical protein
MTVDGAETLALEALAWIAGDGGLIERFVNDTGIAPSELLVRAADSAFLGGVLDFLMAEDERVTGFAAFAGVPPTDPAVARALLPGGRQVHWT